MGGISKITQTEILAWQQNHGVRLTSWELEMIAVFDDIATDSARKRDAKPT